MQIGRAHVWTPVTHNTLSLHDALPIYIKVALRRLRKFARLGAEDELALDATIKATANNAGFLDIKMQPERKNNIKVLMLLDVGGTINNRIHNYGNRKIPYF